MPEITVKPGVVTQINVFTVPPENQERLIELLITAANSVRDVPGWMSASIHRGLDGTRVVNYAQCESYAAWEAVMERLRAGGFLEKNKELGVAAPGLYEVAVTLAN